MRQHDQVERVLGKRQPQRVRQHLGRRRDIDSPARRDPALREKRRGRQPDLDRVKAEDVGDGTVEPRLLARKQVAAERCLKPLGERR